MQAPLWQCFHLGKTDAVDSTYPDDCTGPDDAAEIISGTQECETKLLTNHISLGAISNDCEDK